MKIPPQTKTVWGGGKKKENSFRDHINNEEADPCLILCFHYNASGKGGIMGSCDFTRKFAANSTQKTRVRFYLYGFLRYRDSGKTPARLESPAGKFA
ncbi:hypothetical protein [Intestinibacillus massiliensis]